MMLTCFEKPKPYSMNNPVLVDFLLCVCTSCRAATVDGTNLKTK